MPGAIWTATRITSNAAEKFQLNSGILVKNFNIGNPTQPDDEDILFDTTGDFSFTNQPTTHNLFEGVNNAPTNIKEGLIIDDWTNTLTITALSVTLDSLKSALGAADIEGTDGVRGRMAFASSDFQTLTWIGDMAGKTKLLAIQLENAVSTGGITFSATDRGKGGISLTFTAFFSLADIEKVPMAFYILEKA